MTEVDVVAMALAEPLTDETPTPMDITGEASTSIEPEVTETPVSDAVAEVAAALAPENTGPTDDDIIAGLLGSIKPVAEMSPFLRACIFGEPGVRKTSFAASASGPLIYEVDFGGSKSLLNHPELAGTRVMQFKSLYQANQLVRMLTEDRPEFESIKTLVIDTYSGFESKMLASVGFQSDGSPNYNANSSLMKDFTDRLRQVKKHVIVLCHIKEEKDGTSGAILRRPDMTPQVTKAMSGMFDIIGFMDVKEDEWTLRLQKSGPYSAKSRVGGLPDVMVNPNFQEIERAYETMRINATK